MSPGFRSRRLWMTARMSDVGRLDLVDDPVGIERHLAHGLIVQLRYYAADARQRIERHTLLHQLLRDLLGVMLRVLGDVIVDMT